MIRTQTGIKRVLHRVALLILLAQAPLAVALTPETGWWWNSSEPGRGFNIEVQNNIVTVATYVYDETGQPVWYTATGTLDANNTVTGTLSSFQNGQCIQCEHRTPQGPNPEGTVTIQFQSASRAELNWPGGTVSIERFNYALGQWYEGLLGQWMIVRTNPTRPVTYAGDLLTLSAHQKNGNDYFVSGSRSQDSSATVVMTSLDRNLNDQYSFLALVDAGGNFTTAYAFNFSGLHTIEGIYKLVLKSDTETDILDQLTSTGKSFTGKRL